MQGNKVVQWSALSQGRFLALGFSCVEFACSPVSAWVLSRYYGFLPQSYDMQLSRIGNSKLAVGVSVSANVCLALRETVVLSTVQTHLRPKRARIGSGLESESETLCLPNVSDRHRDLTQQSSQTMPVKVLSCPGDCGS